VPDAINPEAGAGTCSIGVSGSSFAARTRVNQSAYADICWPYAERFCREHTAHQRYEMERAAWIAANANASPQEYEQAMRENAQRAGV
tara:strand:- start:1572 stop:1835 length:264 start_codon:yes stop_codon:yes gene_type:complete